MILTAKISRNEWLFLLACLGLGVLAEVSFLHGRIGVSYLVFIAGFYTVLFLRFQLRFNHRRIGLLFTAAIWVLGGSYLLYDNEFFYFLNLFVIPILMFAHIVLITSPNTFKWNTPKFIIFMQEKLHSGITYSLEFCNRVYKLLFKNMDDQVSQILKRILIGLVISIPLLIVIIGLLMSADAVFENLVMRLPIFLLQFNFWEVTFRIGYIILISALFFGVFQVLLKHSKPQESAFSLEKEKDFWDSITAITILSLLNLVYLLFVAIQFKYFFGTRLADGFTYAEYARRGFFELILVMLINWTILTSFLKKVQDHRRGVKITINILYSLLIVFSGIMLASAYQRLSMYEAAYGFTIDRLLAHAFMIFLMVILGYTLIKVWIERLSLTHFYLIIGLTFYTGLNAIDMTQIVVDQNLERFKETGKIDVEYLERLSYTGVDGLIQLYEMKDDDPELESILLRKKEWVNQDIDRSWQSFNFTRQKVVHKLNELDLEGVHP